MDSKEFKEAEITEVKKNNNNQDLYTDQRRSRLKGKARYFRFLNDGDQVHKVRNWLEKSASRHRAEVNQSITKLNDEAKENLDKS